MDNRWQIALSAGLLAALWCGIADIFHLVTWVGFLGCSSYFAQPKKGLSGVVVSWCTNLSGVFWAWLVISASSYFDTQLMGYLFTGIATSLMCLQASYHKLSFIPGAFIGCCTTFALGGEVKMLVPALILGALLGYAMTLLTSLLIVITPWLKKNMKAIKTLSSPSIE
ncbi:hypothetical protein GCM10007916_28550 [Psychromonas marina]|uniref:DUF1097 domain-containing protein n=1 Tax=Psychromonas marina TaxID=88364 RepID=A0ABQ6E3K9_9GAMM|nr:DUF1097 domain-containing protein [Psychromonas marina]GLS91785.1 hypothetical protein GCM10007916_28550 [Psychromonas marina]